LLGIMPSQLIPAILAGMESVLAALTRDRSAARLVVLTALRSRLVAAAPALLTPPDGRTLGLQPTLL